MNFKKWSALLFFACTFTLFQAESAENIYQNSSNEEFKIIFSDIENFKNSLKYWEQTNQTHNLKLLENQYLSIGSLGLNEFYRLKIRNKQKFVDTVDGLYEHYKSLDIFTFEPNTLRPQLTQMFSKFSKWTNEAHPLDVYFVIGRLNSAGTVTDKGILIGTEHFVKSIPSELSNKGYKFSTFDSLLPTIAHEYVHSLQNQAGPPTLIRAVIFEGGADFLAELVTGVSPFKKEHYRYGLANEPQVWNKFIDERYSTDVSNWIANRKNDNWPADMGYYIGYQIAKDFYHNMSDKGEAFKHLTNVSKPEYILKISQYGSDFK